MKNNILHLKTTNDYIDVTEISRVTEFLKYSACDYGEFQIYLKGNSTPIFLSSDKVRDNHSSLEEDYNNVIEAFTKDTVSCTEGQTLSPSAFALTEEKESINVFPPFNLSSIPTLSFNKGKILLSLKDIKTITPIKKWPNKNEYYNINLYSGGVISINQYYYDSIKEFHKSFINSNLKWDNYLNSVSNTIITKASFTPICYKDIEFSSISNISIIETHTTISGSFDTKYYIIYFKDVGKNSIKIDSLVYIGDDNFVKEYETNIENFKLYQESTKHTDTSHLTFPTRLIDDIDLKDIYKIGKIVSHMPYDSYIIYLKNHTSDSINSTYYTTYAEFLYDYNENVKKFEEYKNDKKEGDKEDEEVVKGYDFTCNERVYFPNSIINPIDIADIVTVKPITLQTGHYIDFYHFTVVTNDENFKMYSSDYLSVDKFVQHHGRIMKDVKYYKESTNA